MSFASAWLAVGTASLLDAVNLMGTGPDAIFIDFGGLKIEAIDKLKTKKQEQAWGDTREITMQLNIQGSDGDIVAANLGAINRKLYQAERASGKGSGVWIGTPVTLWLRQWGASQYIYFDVVLGALDQKDADSPAPFVEATLTLHVLPYARGQTLAGVTTALISNSVASFYIPNVPGDVDALCKYTIADSGAAGALATPTGVTVVPATTGGVLTSAGATAYGYRVTAYGGGGETLASATVSATMPSTSAGSNAVSWTQVPGASSYGIYGRTGGSELHMATLPNTALSWVDNGTVTPAGALPGSNTSRSVANRWHGGRRSAPGLVDADFTPLLPAQAVVPTQFAVDVGAATGGTFTLTFSGNTTAAIPYNAGAQRIRDALGLLASIGGNANVSVTGSGSVNDPWLISLIGTFAATVQPSITGTSSLTAGTLTITRLTSTVISDTTAPGGSAVRMVESTNFNSAALFTQPGSGLYQSGTFDAFLIVRDVGGSIGQTGAPSFTFAPGGTLPAGTYTVEIVQLDGFSHQGQPSPAAAYTTPGVGQLGISWIPNGAYVTTQVYYLGPTGVWKYVTAAAGQSSILLSADSGTAGTPPAGAQAAAASSQVKCAPAINAPMANYQDGDAFNTRIGNGVWEKLYIGQITLSPILARLDLGLPGWQLLVQARTLNTTGTSTLDIAALLLYPADEPQWEAESSGLQLYTQRTLIYDTRQDMGSSAQLTDGSGNPQGQMARHGQLLLGVGGNKVVLCNEGVGGAFDANSQFTVRYEITPRFALQRGVG